MADKKLRQKIKPHYDFMGKNLHNVNSADSSSKSEVTLSLLKLSQKAIKMNGGYSSHLWHWFGILGTKKCRKNTMKIPIEWSMWAKIVKFNGFAVDLSKRKNAVLKHFWRFFKVFSYHLIKCFENTANVVKNYHLCIRIRHRKLFVATIQSIYLHIV